MHRIALCVGCGSQIYDQYILRVSPDLEWHAACLKCADCHQFLDESCTCFVRDGKTYCKKDYMRYVTSISCDFLIQFSYSCCKFHMIQNQVICLWKFAWNYMNWDELANHRMTIDVLNLSWLFQVIWCEMCQVLHEFYEKWFSDESAQ